MVGEAGGVRAVGFGMVERGIGSRWLGRWGVMDPWKGGLGGRESAFVVRMAVGKEMPG